MANQEVTPAQAKPAEDFAWAVKTGDLNSVKDFVEKQKLSVSMTDRNRRTPMHWAADFNQVRSNRFFRING